MPTNPNWTEWEDQELRRLVEEHGPKKWSVISQILGTKGSKQCRRRWKNYLNADLKTGGWTPEEDRMLMEGHKKYGNKWTEIAKIIGGRTDNAVKNRWAALQKRNQRGVRSGGVSAPRGRRRRDDTDTESEDSEEDRSMSPPPRVTKKQNFQPISFGRGKGPLPNMPGALTTVPQVLSMEMNGGIMKRPIALDLPMNVNPFVNGHLDLSNGTWGGMTRRSPRNQLGTGFSNQLPATTPGGSKRGKPAPLQIPSHMDGSRNGRSFLASSRDVAMKDEDDNGEAVFNDEYGPLSTSGQRLQEMVHAWDQPGISQDDLGGMPGDTPHDLQTLFMSPMPRSMLQQQQRGAVGSPRLGSRQGARQGGEGVGRTPRDAEGAGGSRAGGVAPIRTQPQQQQQEEEPSRRALRSSPRLNGGGGASAQGNGAGTGGSGGSGRVTKVWDNMQLGPQALVVASPRDAGGPSSARRGRQPNGNAGSGGSGNNNNNNPLVSPNGMALNGLPHPGPQGRLILSTSGSIGNNGLFSPLLTGQPGMTLAPLSSTGNGFWPGQWGSLTPALTPGMSLLWTPQGQM